MKVKNCLILCHIFLNNQRLAQNIPDEPENYVTDVIDLLSAEQQKHLNDTLSYFEQKTSNQIFILITDSLYGQNLEEITIKTAATPKSTKKPANHSGFG